MNIYPGTGITIDMLQADFWLARANQPDRVWLSPAEITAFNAQVYEILQIPPVFALPDHLSADEVRGYLDRYQIPTNPRYNGAGQRLDNSYFQHLQHNASPELPDSVQVRYGIAVERTSVRRFPTPDIVTNPAFDLATDYFQETAIDPGWAVAVIATSRDQQWHFCLTPLYWGWVPAAAIAIGDKAEIEAYTNAPDFVTVIASQGLIGLASGSGITPQMGTRLPLLEVVAEEVYRVQVPQRLADGSLTWAEGYTNPGFNQFHVGDLPLTLRNIFTLAFSLLEERYAWGCSRLGIFGRDCSRYLRDVYATTGLYLPRNADEQGDVGRLCVSLTDEMSAAERKKLIVDHATPGDLLIMPDHIMLYLGHLDGEPYVIHAKGGKHKRILVSDLNINEELPTGAVLGQITKLVSLR